MSSPESNTFPFAQQAQIIRANQRDTFHISSLKEQTETVLRSWLGTRWLSRWDKEVDLFTKLLYIGMTTGRGKQTLGEEYTNIWQYSAFTRRTPQAAIRSALVLLPTVSAYALARWSRIFGSRIRALLTTLEVLGELNLAIFYIKGAYYSLAKRVLGIRQISPSPVDPRTRPPSYSLLGFLIITRLCYRLVSEVREWRARNSANIMKQSMQPMPRNDKESFLDDIPVHSLLNQIDPDAEPAKSAEEDQRTMLDVTTIPEAIRAGRNCTLCLEERTDSCATECGHLFCWPCIVGWGREKAECPLCRQALDLKNLLPVYNL